MCINMVQELLCQNVARALVWQNGAIPLTGDTESPDWLSPVITVFYCEREMGR